MQAMWKILIICLSINLLGCNKSRFEPYKDYYSSGKIKESGERVCESYFCGKPIYSYHGMNKMWYENNQIKSHLNYQNGKLEGLSKTWYKNGKLKYSVNWKENLKSGPFVVYYDDGKKSAEGDFDAGNLKSATYYNPKGIKINQTEWTSIIGNKKFW